MLSKAKMDLQSLQDDAILQIAEAKRRGYI
jgi:hypothetical protein